MPICNRCLTRSAFVDRIRQGRTSAEGILSTMQQMASSDDGIYSSALVHRAKEVDDHLKASEERLSRALKPSFDDLSATIVTIKNLWADIRDYVSEVVELANTTPNDTALILPRRNFLVRALGLPRGPDAACQHGIVRSVVI